MTTTSGSSRQCAKILVVDRDGRIRHLPRAALACLFSPGDLIVANDAATLPASLTGIHYPSGGSIEVRLAAWESVHDPTQFTAIAFGAGDYRTPTEDRISRPPLSPGDRLSLGPLVGVVEVLPSTPISTAFLRRSRKCLRRACPTRSADLIRARTRAACVVGRLDENCL